ncbi:MAG: hypothetical protein FWB96_04260 [Defluviitaleaceae bacterium]|nr:hypothetical protein [Defluviitaleaceae bacterium]
MKIKFAAVFMVMVACLMPMAVVAQPNPPTDIPMRQRPISESTMVVNPAASGGTSYNLNIMWSRPQLSTVPDFNVPPERLAEAAASETLWTLFPTRYLVDFRNATRGEVFGGNPSLPQIEIAAPANGQLRTLPTGTRLEVSTGARAFTMQQSSLYEIRIDPIRPVPIILPPPVPGAEGILSSRNALIDNSPGLPLGRDLLFLTDIPLEGRGRGNSITITWQDPTWGGMNIFPYWQISYGDYVPGAPISGARVITRPVGGSDAGSGEIVQNPDGTLSYTLFDPRIPPIGFQQISVNPAFGPNPEGVPAHRVRQGQSSAYTIISGRQFEIFFTTNEYSTVVTMIPELFSEQAGAQFIRLWWPHLTGIAGMLNRVEIEEWPADMEGEVPDPGMSPMSILRVLGGYAFLGINEIFVGPGIPREPRGFALAIHLNDGTVLRTEVIVYDPHIAEFSPYRPELVRVDHVDGGAISMEWLAFLRFPAVADEIALVPEGDPYNGRFVDTAMYYEIFVSDSWEDMGHMTTPLLTINPSQLEASRRLSPVQPQPYPLVFDPTWQFWPFDNVTQYQALTDDGIVVRDIRGNRVYFVRIRAVREPGGQSSSWAYGSVYVPPLDPFIITPEMISSPPVEIPSEATVHITESSIPLRWDTRYLEIMWPGDRDTSNFRDPDRYPPRNIWHTVIGATLDNRPIFGRSATQINYVASAPDGALPRHEFLNRMIEPALRERLLGLDEFPMNPNNPAQLAPVLNDAREQINNFTMNRWDTRFHPMALRMQNTDDFSYQLHVVPYQTVRLHPRGFEGYRDTIPAGSWVSIGQPEITDGVKNHVVTELSENTAYVIFIRPYVTIGGQVVTAAFPTFVVGTTVVTPIRPVPDPSTPVLHPVPRYTTRNRVGVRWRVQDNMVYEVRVSHFFSDYPNGGTVIPIVWEDIQAALDDQTIELENPHSVLEVIEVEGTPYLHLRIHERFPDTTYYIWARAVGVDNDGNVITPPSLPSNPVDIHTNDIEPPAPPRSLARVPQNLLDMFNRYNDTEYRNDEPEALTISFMRIFEDLRDVMGNLTERAEAGAGDAGVRPLNMPNLDVTESYVAIHITRFENLIANRNYYIRARTILTVERDSPDVFSYEIQLADNEDFLDAVTFTIPPLVEMNPITMRRATSNWVNIEVGTGVSDGEFDSAHRPDQYPMPERDFEITYDPLTQSLIWRFRTNQRGADGRLDQNVDQRFITRLIQDNVFQYTIDLSNHNNMPIANREIIMPESILRAFDGRRIALEILAGDTNVVIPPGAFDTAQTRALQPGIGTYYRIAINNVDSGMPPLVTNTEFATVPQRFSVSAMTPQRTENLNTFARPVIVELPVERHTGPDGLRTGLFVNDPNTASWRDTQGQFSFFANSLSSGIQNPTTFAGISRVTPPMAVPQTPANAPAVQAMERVATRFTLTDMTSFNPSHPVTANEFNNIVNALVTGNSSATMGATIPPANVSSLTRARLHAAADPTRETAMDIMVRLYENRTRQILTPMTPEDSVPGIQNANPALRNNLRKAADIGFITGPLEPNSRLTMGEMMNMVDIIIIDAGM